jgi:ribosomal protein S18 acetylase RimI-like enzyme
MIHDSPVPSIERVAPEEEPVLLPQLVLLLQDAVTGGASVGFLLPLSAEEAGEYWRSVFQEVAQSTRVLLVARDAGQVVGSVQLALVTKPNGRHRAEVQKLLVFASQRRRGTGRALMRAIEQAASEAGRTLLVLDTVPGYAAEQLYRSMDYCEAGQIPEYARSVGRTLEPTVVFYKILRQAQ